MPNRSIEFLVGFEPKTLQLLYQFLRTSLIEQIKLRAVVPHKSD